MPIVKDIDKKEGFFLDMLPEEFDKFMCSTFPELFQDRNKPMSETCMCWGFTVNGAGWYQLLYDLCIKLEFIRQQTGITTVFDQIKEKFGGGRFYYHIDGVDCKLEDNIREIWCGFIEVAVDKAERESEQTCGICGKTYFHDKIVIGGWVYDSCKECMVSGKRTDRKDITQELERIEKHHDRLNNLKWKIDRMKDAELIIVEKICAEIEARMKTIIT